MRILSLLAWLTGCLVEAAIGIVLTAVCLLAGNIAVVRNFWGEAWRYRRADLHEILKS